MKRRFFIKSVTSILIPLTFGIKFGLTDMDKHPILGVDGDIILGDGQVHTMERLPLFINGTEYFIPLDVA